MLPIFNCLYQLYAFFRRDAINDLSYKLNFVFNIVYMFVFAFTMGFLGQITQSAQAQYMQAYGNINVATFLIIGHMLQEFMSLSQFAPQNIANPGRLERILLTPCSIPVFILGSMSWAYFLAILNMVICIFLGVTVFGMNLFIVDWLTLITILLIGVITMWGLGIISSAIQMVTKRWNPVNWFLSTFSLLVSGIFYPPEALLTVDATGLLYSVAWFLPHTYVYYMARLAFAGKGLLDMLFPLFNLVIMAAIFFGIAWFIFKLCLRRCQLEGSLGWV